MVNYRVWSIAANGGGKRVDEVISASDRKHALVRAKMLWSERNGYLPRAGLRFGIELTTEPVDN